MSTTAPTAPNELSSARVTAGFLSPAARRTLAAVCDTISPSLPPPAGTPEGSDEAAYWRRSASDLHAHLLIEGTLAVETSPAEQRLLKLALASMENPALCLATTGSATPFSKRDLSGRTRLLLAWSKSPIPLLRQTFQTLKRLSGFAFFTAPGVDDSPNPNLAALHYPDPWRPPDRPAAPANPLNPTRPVTITEDTTLTADACVVGSGAGGGVVAALLAQAGMRVVVLEAGDAYNEAQFDPDEGRAFTNLFAKGGVQASSDGRIAILSGRTLGGGTTVNWLTCFRPSQALLKQWAESSGVDDLLGPELRAGLDAVERRLHVDKDESYLNASNATLIKGTHALGWHGDIQARNVNGCGDCGMCSFGCPWGAKQSTRRTYLQDAYDAGATIVTNATAVRVLFEGKKATGVLATTGTPGAFGNAHRQAHAHRLTVRAPLVVVAAGGIESPALLLRSGVKHDSLGRNLYVHPVSVTLGLFDKPVSAWSGPMQAAHSDQFANLDGHGYGFKFETTPIYPGLGATAMPWSGGRGFKERMLRLQDAVTLLTLTRDKVGGRVRIDRWGNPRIDYALSTFDAAHLLKGVREGARVVLAAGASEAFTLHQQLTSITRAESEDPAMWRRFDARVNRLGAKPNSLVLLSAHQMGTCRMSADPAAGVVDGSGALYGYEGVYVADSSIFPLSSGINPMITIMGLAHYIGSRLARSR